MPEIVKPNLTAIQTAFTARLYSWDLIVLYRAVSGKYPSYASILGGGIGLTIQQDVVTFLGAFGPIGRSHYVLDIYSAIYNDMMEKDLKSFSELLGFWEGWSRFTQLLKEDAEEVGEPLKFPAFTYPLPKFEVDAADLSGPDRFIYILYRGDVDSMEILLTLLSQYVPETVFPMPALHRDLSGIFELYAQWARERFTGAQASQAARVMAKVILLANYRWFLLAGDLLSMIEPIFHGSFSKGMAWIAGGFRNEAEKISMV
ncbi:hypothetical protein LCGC14_1521230 [marine sediment metagenome]|uniref:Uncharacterized protein n=1 Tax=marine sediment metagenome TaxID=412755 RepID=A0A0F9IYT0_9ZZZZ